MSARPEALEFYPARRKEHSARHGTLSSHTLHLNHWSPSSFCSSQNLFSVVLDYCVVSSLHVSFTACTPKFLWWIICRRTSRTYDLILALGNHTKLSSAKFITCFLELFLGGDSYKNPIESEVGKICFGSPTDCNFSGTCGKIHSLHKSWPHHI